MVLYVMILILFTIYQLQYVAYYDFGEFGFGPTCIHPKCFICSWSWLLCQCYKYILNSYPKLSFL